MKNIEGARSLQIHYGFVDPIEKQLKGCEYLPAQSFVQIETDEMPVCLKSNLSLEKKYIYNMCHAISNGICSQQLLNRNPGYIVHTKQASDSVFFQSADIFIKTKISRLIW